MRSPELHAVGKMGKLFPTWHVAHRYIKSRFLCFQGHNMPCKTKSPLYPNVGNYFPNITQVIGSLGTKVFARCSPGFLTMEMLVSAKSDGLNCFRSADSLMLALSRAFVPDCESACSNRGDDSPQVAGAVSRFQNWQFLILTALTAVALLAHAGAAVPAVG